MRLAAAILSLLTSLPAQVLQHEPSSGAHLRTFYPTLTATIARADLKSVHVFVDGRDVTQLTSMSGGQLQYIPHERMQAGWHDVFLEGTGRDRRRFSDAWVFQTEPPDGSWPVSSSTGTFQFFPSGGNAFFPGSFMHFFLIAPDDGFAVLQLCGLGQFPFEHQPFSPVFFVTVAVPVTPFSSFFDCQIGALFTPFGGFNTVLLPLPVGISIFSNRHHGRTAPAITAPAITAPSMTSPRMTSPGVPVYGNRTTMPVYRVPEAPAYHAPMTAPVYRANPVVAPNPMPVSRPIGVPHPVVLPRSAAGVPHSVLVPHPAVPGRP